MIQPLLILGIIIAGLAAVIYLREKYHSKKLDEIETEMDGYEAMNQELLNQLEAKNKLITQIKEHYTRINLTEEELEPVKQKVKEATSEEEVMDAVNLIINRNSRRMRDNQD